MKKLELSSHPPTPPDLDQIADLWRAHIDEHVTIEMTQDLTEHLEGTYCAYHLSITFNKPEGPLTVHYAGQTSRPPHRRASEHKSELKTCKATTNTGKSSVYSSRFFGGVQKIDMHFRVHSSGLDSDQALNAEAALAEDLQRRYGKELVLTQPKGKKPKKVKT